MPVELKECEGGKVLEVHVSGKLTKEDYEKFIPEVERLVQSHGTISILFEMHDFHGWEVAAAWEDTKFAIRHFSDIKRLAVIGEKRWQKGMTTFCKPFTRAEIQYFEHSQAEQATAWLREV